MGSSSVEPVERMSEEGASPPRPRPTRGRTAVAVGILLLVVGALLVGTCTSLTLSAGCTSEDAGSCTEYADCPVASGLGVIMVTAGLGVVALGFVWIVGRRPEGEVPHPEPKRSPRPKETAMTRMERERREAQERRQDDG